MIRLSRYATRLSAGAPPGLSTRFRSFSFVDSLAHSRDRRSRTACEAAHYYVALAHRLLSVRGSGVAACRFCSHSPLCRRLAQQALLSLAWVFLDPESIAPGSRPKAERFSEVAFAHVRLRPKGDL